MNTLTPYQQKALNYKDHIALTANAGSGKTFVLSKRFVEIALNEDVPLNSIVAITFTEKAASELYRKIAGEIEERIAVSDDVIITRKLEKLRRNLVSANISTIHSFCVNILREFSTEAGIDANFTPIDQTTAAELIDEVIQNFLFDSLIDNSSMKDVVRVMGGTNAVTRALKLIVEKRKTFNIVLQNICSKEPNRIVDFLNDLFDEYFQVAVLSKLPLLISSIKRVNEYVLSANSENLIALETTNIINQIESADKHFELAMKLNELFNLILTDKGTVKKRGYINKDGIENFITEISFIEKFANDCSYFELKSSQKSDLDLANFGKTLAGFGEQVISIYKERKHQKGFLDFEDLLLYTEEILRNPEIQYSLNAKFKYIMIDEYQDTNEIQYNIFMPVLKHLQTGNLFVVGDEKQSIYMFRDAELEVFNKTKREISAGWKNENILELPHSFRVSPKIALFTNTLFSKLFSTPDERFNEVEHNNLISMREDFSTGAIEILITDSTLQSESEMTAHKILNLVNNSELELSFGDITILTRKRNSFRELERIFSQLNIPYYIVGGKGYYQRQLIYDLHNYLTFLLFPNNDASLIGIFRSPFYCLSDDIIFLISRESGESFFSKFQKFALHHDESKRILELLNTHLGMIEIFSVSKVIRKILIDTGYWSILTAKQNALQELGNLEKLIDIARKYEGLDFKPYYDFVDYLSRSITSLEDESQAQVSGSENAVKIMTLHQSKGLEFKVVFLYGCNEKVQQDRVELKNIVLDKKFGILTKLPSENSYFNEYESASIIGVYNYVSKRKNLAEAKRLLYVGITRAINYLIITASHKNYCFNTDSFMDLVVNSLGLSLPKSSIDITGDLEILVKKTNNFEKHSKKITVEIPIVEKIEFSGTSAEGVKSEEFSNREILVDPIIDQEKNEIISATKIAIYHQCPMKYNLIYNLGFSDLMSKIKYSGENYNFNNKEDEELRKYSDLKGRVIHALLENEKINGVDGNTIRKLILGESQLEKNNEKIVDKLQTEIHTELNNYFKSPVYREISTYKNFKNEFELYIKQNNYFLFGIIDKVIFENDIIIVVDYKTDYMKAAQVDEKILNYEPQLKFYLFLLYCSFKKIRNFEYRLVFIQEPEKSITKVVDLEQVESFGRDIKIVVEKIRAGSYQKNLNHCPKCPFKIYNACIVKEIEMKEKK